MQHTKYEELKGETTSLMDKTLNLHKMQKSILTLLRDMDLRLQALTDLCVSRGLFSLVEYDEVADQKRGLRLKGPEEKIEKGDIVWVDYKYRVEGKDHEGEEEMPIRVGAGGVLFESALIGKCPNTENIAFSSSVMKGPKKGTLVEFFINAKKVKTPIVKEDELDGTDGRSEGESAGGDKPVDQGDGSGHQERGYDDCQCVQDGQANSCKGGVCSADGGANEDRIPARTEGQGNI